MKHKNSFFIRFLYSATSITISLSLTMSVSQAASFDALLEKSDRFEKNICQFPIKANMLANIAGDDKNKQKKIEWQAANTYPILSKPVLLLICNIVAHKKKYGTNTEKELYNSMDLQTFLNRLLNDRPLAFYLKNDTYLLPDGTQGQGGFETIGTDTEQKPLSLKKYLSYDEMPISALLGVSTPTYFINKGDRFNKGAIGKQDSYQKEGVYIALVGPRFEKPNYMEWQHMVVTREQNTIENGYGQYNKNTLLSYWAQLYGINYFRTFEQAVQDTSNRFLKINNIDNILLDKIIYKKRLELVLFPFLVDANRRGKISNKKAYCHVVGLGTGVWALDKNAQEQLMLEVYEKLLNTYHFSYIADINFSWFEKPISHNTTLYDGALITQANNKIKIHFSKRDPAEKLIAEDENKLLVAMYAWDGNAYPGNEYWMQNLSGSGDPAAACCSTIQELQNPLINDNVSGKNSMVTNIFP